MALADAAKEALASARDAFMSDTRETQKLLDEADVQIRAEALELFGDSERGRQHRKMLEKAVIDTARAFVLDVMKANVEAMNKSFAEELEKRATAAIDKAKSVVDQLISGEFDKLRHDIKKLDAKDRAVFLRELEEIVDAGRLEERR